MTTTVTLTGTGVPIPAPGRAGPGALVRFDDIPRGHRPPEELSRGADLLVHEACRTSALRDAIAGTVFETIFSYHADTPALGAMAERAGVPHLVLTHLIPPPANAGEEHAFASDVRDGGYTGRVTVGSDLYSVDVVAAAQEARSVV